MLIYILCGLALISQFPQRSWNKYDLSFSKAVCFLSAVVEMEVKRLVKSN